MYSLSLDDTYGMCNWPVSLKKNHCQTVTNDLFTCMPDFVFCVEASDTTVTAKRYLFLQAEQDARLSYRLDERYLRLVIGSGSFFFSFLTLDVKTYGGNGGMLDASCAKLPTIMILNHYFFLFLTLFLRFY